MKIILGLGNPGKKYEKTRHNFGFMALDFLRAELKKFSRWSKKNNFAALLAEGEIAGEKILLAKPQTFMNRSGQTAKAIAGFYQIDLADILVVHDDIDLPLGVLRLSKNASAAGHKGVRSIIEALGDKNFVRVRLGIHPIGQTLACANFKKTASIEKFVLKNFSRSEMVLANKIIKKAPRPLRQRSLKALIKQ